MNKLIYCQAAIDAVTLQMRLTGCSPDLMAARDLIRNLPIEVGVCHNCLFGNVCRFKAGLGEYGFCSQWKPQEEGEQDV